MSETRCENENIGCDCEGFVPLRVGPSLPSGSVEPMTEGLTKRDVRIGEHRFVRGNFTRFPNQRWFRRDESGGLHYSGADEWLDRIAALEDELARLRSAGDEAGRRLREAAQELHDAAVEVNARYIGGSPIKGARFSAAIDRLAVAQVKCRAALSSSGTTETSRARAEAERFGENREGSTTRTGAQGGKSDAPR